MRPFEARDDAAAQAGTPAASRLQGVLTSPGRKFALIDGVAVPVGGVWQEGRLVELTESSAVLRKNGQREVAEDVSAHREEADSARAGQPGANGTMKLAAAAASLALVAGCAAPPPPKGVLPAISSELASAAERKPPARPEALDRALLPPVLMGMPSVAGVDLEPRFDLNVSNAPAAQVFMSIVSGTRYSILLHPDVSGVISVSLKDVTVEETLSAIRELYGYEYRAEGTRIFVQPAGMQTRVFQVNYPPGQRRGTTDLRVTSARSPIPAGAARRRPAARRRRARHPAGRSNEPGDHPAEFGPLGRLAHGAARHRRHR